MINDFPYILGTSTGYFSNSTGSSVTNRRFSLIIEPITYEILRYTVEPI